MNAQEFCASQRKKRFGVNAVTRGLPFTLTSARGQQTFFFVCRGTNSLQSPQTPHTEGLNRRASLLGTRTTTPSRADPPKRRRLSVCSPNPGKEIHQVTAASAPRPSPDFGDKRAALRGALGCPELCRSKPGPPAPALASACLLPPDSRLSLCISAHW